MNNYEISVNQLAEFSNATPGKKRSIIKQQRNPVPVKAFRYRLAMARMKKSLQNKGNLNPVYDGIKTLTDRKPETDWQKNDRSTSIEVLERYVKMKLPQILQDIDYEVVKNNTKSFHYSDVRIIVAPEIILRGKLNGEIVLGGIKLHISKSKPFDFKKSKYAATTVYRFLNEAIAKQNETVLPELCFCLDVFGGRMVPADSKYATVYSEIDDLISEFKEIWDKSPNDN